MLAAKVTDLAQLKYPILASPKIDGLRAIVKDGQLLSRTLKRIPNMELQERASDLPDGLDGELVLGIPTGPGVFNRTQSGLMSYDGDLTGLTYIVFDLWDKHEEPYHARNSILRNLRIPPWCMHLEQTFIENVTQLETYEQQVVDLGYEGVMLRTPNSLYKYGRSTFNESYLIKLKRFADSEAEVIGYEPLFENQNAKEYNEVGYSKRSSAQGGLVEVERLGALRVRQDIGGTVQEFGIGSGFTLAERVDLWRERDALIGKQVRYKYLPYGQKDKPRHPTFLGFRYD